MFTPHLIGTTLLTTAGITLNHATACDLVNHLAVVLEELLRRVPKRERPRRGGVRHRAAVAGVTMVQAVLFPFEVLPACAAMRPERAS